MNHRLYYASLSFVASLISIISLRIESAISYVARPHDTILWLIISVASVFLLLFGVLTIVSVRGESLANSGTKKKMLVFVMFLSAGSIWLLLGLRHLL